MGKLEALVKKWGELPTFMEIEQEILIINDIMQLSFYDIASNKELFCEIIENLELSHTESYYELTRKNERVFMDFYRWLADLIEKNNFNLNYNIISTFSLTYDDVMAEKESYKNQ